MLEYFDVAIVGGGPAGSSCALRLSQAGAKVVIIDQKIFPRTKTCGGWVTPAVFEKLGVAPEEYADHHIMQPIRGFRTGMIGGDDLETRYDSVVSYGIRRIEFDAYLLNRCGAEVRMGQAVRSLHRRNDKWQVNDMLEAPVLVGAGGHFCPVARMLGARDIRQTSVVTAQEVEFQADEQDLLAGSVEADIPELFFCHDFSGYGWCFRKGAYLNIGLGRVGATHLSDDVTDFVDFLRQRGKIVAPLPERFHGHAYQIYERVHPRLTGEGVLLVGDAAGLAHSLSGEGIRPAVESGLIAAQVINDTHQRPDGLSIYTELIRAHFGDPGQSIAPAWLPQSWLHWAARKLLGSHWFTRHVVLDDWFLHRTV